MLMFDQTFFGHLWANFNEISHGTSHYYLLTSHKKSKLLCLFADIVILAWLLRGQQLVCGMETQQKIWPAGP